MSLKSYCFSSPSPTFTQLSGYLSKVGWVKSTDVCHAQLSDLHFECPDLIHLEYKHLLNKLCASDMPWGIYLDDFNWHEQIKSLSIEGPWILKPSMLNNGQHIQLFENTASLIAHYQQNKRMGGPHLLQSYIQFPHLLKGPEKGHKYSIRMFVVMNANQAYLYPQGYFNIALNPYDASDLTLKKAHLTNEHLDDTGRNVVQIPTSQYALFKPFSPQILSICQRVVQKFYQSFNMPDHFKLAFLGVDFLVCAKEKVWLLEINHGPCFPIQKQHPLYFSLYENFWQSVVAELLGDEIKLKHFVPLRSE
jgi:hypothetical protein